jgi:hypothetical protein
VNLWQLPHATRWSKAALNSLLTVNLNRQFGGSDIIQPLQEFEVQIKNKRSCSLEIGTFVCEIDKRLSEQLQLSVSRHTVWRIAAAYLISHRNIRTSSVRGIVFVWRRLTWKILSVLYVAAFVCVCVPTIHSLNKQQRKANATQTARRKSVSNHKENT